LILPALGDLFAGLARHPAFQELLARLRKPRPGCYALTGLNATAQALYAALLYQQLDRPIVMLVESNSAADSALETVEAFFDLLELPEHRGRPMVIPAHDVTPYDDLSPHAEISEKRGAGLWRLASGAASIAAVPVGAALLKTAPGDFFRHFAWRFEPGDEFFLEDLEEGLLSAGYRRHEPVEMAGQFAVRGGIIDVYSPEAPNPVRLELLGDQLESIREFNPETQKSIQTLDEALLPPMTDYPVSGAVREAFGGGAGSNGDFPLPPGWEFHPALSEQRTYCLLELAGPALTLWAEPAQIEAAAGKLWERLEEAAARKDGFPPPHGYYLTLEELQRAAAAGSQVRVEELGIGAGPEPFSIPSRRTPRFQGNIPHSMRELQGQIKAGARCLMAAGSVGDVERLADILSEYGVTFQLGLKDPAAAAPYLEEKAYLAGPLASTIVVQAGIREGAVFPDSHVVIYGSEDLFPPSEMVARPQKRRSAASTFLPDLQDLEPGDRVVHAEHGVGRYLGLTQVEHAGRQEDFMLIEYAGGAKLYLPLSRLDLLQKYHGAGGKAPPLDRMGGQTWQRTKSRVKARLKDMAGELLKLYAQRRTTPGFAFSPDSNWQREFEDAFPYTETGDQLAAIRDVKRDMEAPRPMDRLVCGDVGFGKTEVAMRAAFKALGDGKQAALLAPTTVLAFQHYETLRQRFAAFPVEIEMLTRFRSAKEQKEILERVSAGKVDIVIGTHRLFSKDVEFADLGLLIVDEEQRFGVRHKERLKQLSKDVDVLTLTATPIPRTLHMSLVGLRDISVIQTPPKDRLAIETVVMPFTEEIVRTAIGREVERGGQVYFIHNRVESIWEIASRIQQMFPGLRIGVGHGQMPERELETVMLKFMRHEYDVLVSTTIVENGLDIPLANTMLINNADRYGLSELYQLRGRVGRSNRRAYAYLLVAQDKELSTVARKRLAALKEFSELGSGFKIAALDLELRGAGNLLGAEQHGQIAAVGFETYCRLLEEEMRKLQGETVEEEVRTTLRLQVDVHIPPGYIQDEAQRLQAYKRLAGIRTLEDQERIAADLMDRYGPLPQAVRNLMDYSRLKSRAESLRVQGIERRAQQVEIRFREDSKVEPQKLMRFVAQTPGVQFSPSGVLHWKAPHRAGPELLSSLMGLLDRVSAA